MADDRNNPGPEDGRRVNVNQRDEVRYWTNALGCTEKELREAVAAVGVMVAAVRAYLERRRKG